MHPLSRLLIVGAVSSIATPLAGQAVGAPPADSLSPRCASEAYRALDFWLGEWDVTGADGKHAGRNTIARAQRGCLIVESWRSAGGSNGQSMNFYSPTTGHWHQVWVDDGGTVLMLTGRTSDGAMRFEGETRTERGAFRHRISLTRRDPDTVHQLWEVWPLADTTESARRIAFEGRYRRRAP